MRANGAAGREDASVKQLRREIASLSSRFTEQKELNARQQVEMARQQAEMARQQAEMARQQAEMAQLKSIVKALTTFSTPQATTAATVPAAADALCRALDAGEAAVVAQGKDRKSSLIEVHKSDAHGGAEVSRVSYRSIFVLFLFYLTLSYDTGTSNCAHVCYMLPTLIAFFSVLFA